MSWLSVWGDYLPTMLDGLQVSLLLALISISLGYPLGLLLGLAVSSENLAVRAISLAVVEIGRGAPALVVLYLFYYGLPKAGITMEAMTAASLGLVWNTAAYSSEVMRAGFQSVHRGQIEAANALGLADRHTFLRIVMPQGLRSATPGLMGLSIQVFQATSLAYTIAVPELMKAANNLGSRDFNYLQVFVLAGLVYAAVTLPATWITVYFEKRMNRAYA
ncbi:amino acid ABC transporter permease [Nocardioides cavernaquae]|uniref:Amino acid ABC transporter permease n=1 Tax=Nocardioides cavernaquae TaxID=2321396 RepID=A0A3A5HBA5_9ACTN|nr:amino acid ABC transporter permease [Nocardioides cavernaquae]RJS45257.1 amino acid ABC transporter permease [Nocardioides cavernaquae]